MWEKIFLLHYLKNTLLFSNLHILIIIYACMTASNNPQLISLSFCLINMIYPDMLYQDLNWRL